jgi:hypothetical protein
MTQPRRWFQLHLSTAIVMMLVAALILYLNFIPNVADALDDRVQEVGYGFPWESFGIATFKSGYREGGWVWQYLVLDSIFFIATVALVGLSLEHLIRRRKPQA